jgi:hypothetical protein
MNRNFHHEEYEGGIIMTAMQCTSLLFLRALRPPGDILFRKRNSPDVLRGNYLRRLI